MPKQPLFLQQNAQWSCRDGKDSAFINTEPPTILFFNHYDNMQKVLEKAISLINTTILSIKSKYKVFTPQKSPTYHVRVELTRSMPMWQTARRCPSRWKYPCRMENTGKKTKTGNPSKKPPKLNHCQPHPVLWITMIQTGMTVMPARKGVGSTSVNVSTNVNVRVNVA